MSGSFPILGKFLATSSWNIFYVPLSLSSPSGTPIMWMLVLLILSQSSLRLSSFVFNIFSLFCSVFVLGPAQQDGAEERVLWNLRKKVNIKQDTETFILSKGGNQGTQGLRDQERQGTQGLRDQEAASRIHTAFIVLFR